MRQCVRISLISEEQNDNPLVILEEEGERGSRWKNHRGEYLPISASLVAAKMCIELRSCLSVCLSFLLCEMGKVCIPSRHRRRKKTDRRKGN